MAPLSQIIYTWYIPPIYGSTTRHSTIYIHTSIWENSKQHLSIIGSFKSLASTMNTYPFICSLLLLAIISAPFAYSTDELSRDPLIRQVVSSDGHDDSLISDSQFSTFKNENQIKNVSIRTYTEPAPTHKISVLLELIFSQLGFDHLIYHDIYVQISCTITKLTQNDIYAYRVKNSITKLRF